MKYVVNPEVVNNNNSSNKQQQQTPLLIHVPMCHSVEGFIYSHLIHTMGKISIADGIGAQLSL